MDIREIVDAEGLGEYFDDFLDLVELFGVLEAKHGGERWDSTVTDDSPKYFLKKGATLLCSGDIEQVVESFENIRTSGNHDLINICYDKEKFYLFQFHKK
jgi:hypothetical protein